MVPTEIFATVKAIFLLTELPYRVTQNTNSQFEIWLSHGSYSHFLGHIELLQDKVMVKLHSTLEISAVNCKVTVRKKTPKPDYTITSESNVELFSRALIKQILSLKENHRIV